MAVEDADEVAELRAEVARLRAGSHSERSRRTGWWRSVVVTLLVILIAILAPLAVVARWAHDEIAQTDRYVETVAPLASDPIVQAAVVDRLTTQIIDRLAVEAVTQKAVDALGERGLPPLAARGLSSLTGPLADSIEAFIRKQVTALVKSDTFKTTWEEANRQAHTQLVALLTGKNSDTVDVTGNSVSVNLATVIDATRQALIDQGFVLAERLPVVNAQFTIFQSDDIAKAQAGFRLLNAVNTLLPVLIVVLLALALAAARNRRRTLITAMLAVAVSMLLLGVLLNVGRMLYLDAVPSDRIPPDAAAVIFDTFVRFIRTSLRAILVLGLAVALVAWIAGPSTAAVRTRSGTGKAIGLARHGGERVGLDTGRFGVFLHTSKGVIRAAVLGLALVVYVMEDHPTGRFTLILVVVTAVILLVVELLSRPPAPTAGEDAGAPAGTPPTG